MSCPFLIELSHVIDKLPESIVVHIIGPLLLPHTVEQMIQQKYSTFPSYVQSRYTVDQFHFYGKERSNYRLGILMQTFSTTLKRILEMDKQQMKYWQDILNTLTLPKENKKPAPLLNSFNSTELYF